MAYLLNFVYLLLLAVLSPWLLYRAATEGKYRQGLGAKLLGLVPRRESDRCCVWLHAVSVGEVNLLETLIDEIMRRRPDWECVISTTTLTGFALAKKKHADLQVFYCPLDFSWATAAAMRRVRPHLLVLVELELWPNLIRAARRRGATVAVVNGRLSENSFRGYRRIRPLIGWLLRQIDLVAVQNETYAGRFCQLGASPEAVQVTGSLKFDGAETNRSNPATTRLRKLAGLSDETIIFLAGSTQEPEEALALATFRQLREEHPRLRLVLVPRHPQRFDQVAQLLEESGLSWQRRSHLADNPVEGNPETDNQGTGNQETGDPETDNPDMDGVGAEILLVDTVGELGVWWGAAHIAFVGGSLGLRGGQNMIEPAAYGAAVCFGPNTWNFPDIVSMLLDAGAAEVIADGDALTRFARQCLEEPEFAEQLGHRASRLVAGQLGATRRTVEQLLMARAPSTAPGPHAAPAREGQPAQRRS